MNRQTNRIEALDVTRGIAILGILFMNIQSFSMIDSAYMNPGSFGNFEGVNYWIWYLSHLFTDSKFMAIFSILFGAGIVLFSERAEAKQLGSSLKLHYRRNFWLLIIGLFHGYFIWHGDVLFSYALCSFLLFFFKDLKPKSLLVIAAIFLVIPMCIYSLLGISIPHATAETLAKMNSSWQPSTEEIELKISTFKKGFFAILPHRAPITFQFQTTILCIYTFWRATGMMMLGMALYKMGILSTKKNTKTYLAIGLLSASIGFPLVMYGVQQNSIHEWNFHYTIFTGSMYNYVGSIFISIFYIVAIQIFVKINALHFIKKGLAKVGKLALTNYLMQSLICTFVFYGYGLGLFGQMERSQQLAVVLAVLLFQFCFSIFWTKYFTYGPFEKVYRMLTYKKK